MPPMHPFCRCKGTTPEESLEDIEREIDERIESWNIPEGMSLDEFIDRVNNGELEQIRAEQAAASGENSQEQLTTAEKGGIIHKDNEDFIFEDSKITGYMLCPGKDHYEEFVAVGYSKDNPQKLYNDITTSFKKDDLIYDGKNKGGNDRYYQNVVLGVTKEKPFLVGYEIKEGNLRLVTCYRIGDD